MSHSVPLLDCLRWSDPQLFWSGEKLVKGVRNPTSGLKLHSSRSGFVMETISQTVQSSSDSEDTVHFRCLETNTDRQENNLISKGRNTTFISFTPPPSVLPRETGERPTPSEWQSESLIRSFLVYHGTRNYLFRRLLFGGSITSTDKRKRNSEVFSIRRHNRTQYTELSFRGRFGVSTCPVFMEPLISYKQDVPNTIFIL